MIADYTLLILSCLFAYCTRKFMIGLLFIIGLVVFEMICRRVGGSQVALPVMCMVLPLILEVVVRSRSHIVDWGM